MEELLRKLAVQNPPQGMRERVLAAAHREWEQKAEKSDWVDRLWKSRAFWYSSAAAVLLCLVATFIAPGWPPSRHVPITPADPDATNFAQEISRTLGDGPVLERRMIAYLSGPLSRGNDRVSSRNELLRNMQ